MSELRRIYTNLVGLKIELWNAVEERLRADFGLSLRYFLAMSVIDRLGPCRVGDVAAELAISREAAGQLVGRIESDGYCRRQRRSGRAPESLELTPPGRALVTEAGHAFDVELERRFSAAVPAATLDQFAAALRRLRRPGITALR
jgi:DNA-binding MarR family transcriptional regulator